MSHSNKNKLFINWSSQRECINFNRGEKGMRVLRNLELFVLLPFIIVGKIGLLIGR